MFGRTAVVRYLLHRKGEAFHELLSSGPDVL
jgi:hypothetical protein